MMLGSVIKELLRGIQRNTLPNSGALSEAREALGKGDDAKAKAALQRALEANPNDVQAYLMRASIAKRTRRLYAAEADYRRALVLSPTSADVRVELASVLHELNRFEDALSLINEALALQPGHTAAGMNRGLLLRELGHSWEAEQSLAAALEKDPGNGSAKSLLASIIADQGRIADAKLLLTDVLRWDPNNIDAHWMLATIELSMGEFSSAWDHYEFRLQRGGFLRPRDLPWWTPKSGREGPLLVLAEQALGDEIMFASCYDDLLKDVEECHIECDKRLGALFSRSFPRARILPTRDVHGSTPLANQGAIAQIAAGTVPFHYRRDRASFPDHSGYLRASPKRVAFWRDRLSSCGPGLNVGITWTGGTAKTRRSLRSLALVDLEPVLRVPGVNFTSLQYVSSEPEIDALTQETGIRVHQFPEAMEDYDETASLVCALDLVISVTTAVVHLSGALGKPVWVLVPAIPEWRYMRSGSTMPWYPSARLFRQIEVKQWSSVVKAVADELARAVGRYPRDKSSWS